MIYLTRCSFVMTTMLKAPDSLSTERDKMMFWAYVLKKAVALDDPQTNDDLHAAFRDWRIRHENQHGAKGAAIRFSQSPIVNTLNFSQPSN